MMHPYSLTSSLRKGETPQEQADITPRPKKQYKVEEGKRK